MIWNDHSKLRGTHAIFSGSNYNWVNYTPERLSQYIDALKAKEEGTELHDLASKLIEKKIKLPPVKKTLNMFVNDAIDFGMSSEVVLFYTKHIYGCADAISYEEPNGKTKGILRVSDYKSGTHTASKLQLYIYAAFFCLEYGVDPAGINIYCTIYQNDEKVEYTPSAEEIQAIMEACPECEKEVMLREESFGNV